MPLMVHIAMMPRVTVMMIAMTYLKTTAIHELLIFASRF